LNTQPKADSLDPPASKPKEIAMHQPPPPLSATTQADKSRTPTVLIILLVVGIVGFVGIAMIGLLAAIAIPNFVKARQTAQMNMCINNLRMIDGAKQQWALEHKKESTDTPTQGEVVVFLRNQQLPVCAAGGIYTLNAAGEEPTCSVPDHRLPVSSAPSGR
jgi:competence protein ComGC